MVLVGSDSRVGGAGSQAIQAIPSRSILHKIFQNTGLDTERKQNTEHLQTINKVFQNRGHRTTTIFIISVPIKGGYNICSMVIIQKSLSFQAEGSRQFQRQKRDSKILPWKKNIAHWLVSFRYISIFVKLYFLWTGCFQS